MNLQEIERKRKLGLLDYKWLIRSYTMELDQRVDLDPAVIFTIASPFIYLDRYKDHVVRDRSLLSICHLCTGIDHVVDVNHPDQELSDLAHLFNRLIHSGRELHMCYDCGTMARGVFFRLIQTYRGRLHLSDLEIKRIRDEYQMDKYQKADGVRVLRKQIAQIQRNCLFLCAMQLGEEFGHIYVIEKIYINQKPRYRIYQSCLNAYLLVDYIESMHYAEKITNGIPIEKHLDALEQLFSQVSWSTPEVKTFIKWFKFLPPEDGVKPQTVKKFTSTHIIL